MKEGKLMRHCLFILVCTIGVSANAEDAPSIGMNQRFDRLCRAADRAAERMMRARESYLKNFDRTDLKERVIEDYDRSMVALKKRKEATLIIDTYEVERDRTIGSDSDPERFAKARALDTNRANAETEAQELSKEISEIEQEVRGILTGDATTLKDLSIKVLSREADNYERVRHDELFKDIRFKVQPALAQKLQAADKLAEHPFAEATIAQQQSAPKHKPAIYHLRDGRAIHAASVAQVGDTVSIKDESGKKEEFNVEEILSIEK